MISSFLLVATFSATILTQIDEKRKTEWQTKYEIQYRNWCMVNITGGIKSHHKAVIYSNSQMPSMAIVLQSARDQSPLTAVVCPISMYTHGAFAVAGIDPPFLEERTLNCYMVIIGYKSQFLKWYCQVIFGVQIYPKPTSLSTWGWQHQSRYLCQHLATWRFLCFGSFSLSAQSRTCW